MKECKPTLSNFRTCLEYLEACARSELTIRIIQQHDNESWRKSFNSPYYFDAHIGFGINCEPGDFFTAWNWRPVDANGNSICRPYIASKEVLMQEKGVVLNVWIGEKHYSETIFFKDLQSEAFSNEHFSTFMDYFKGKTAWINIQSTTKTSHTR